MNAQDILKIAGVKSEAELYKKFPTHSSFLAKHGKEIKKVGGRITEIFIKSFNKELEKLAIGSGYREHRNVRSEEVKHKVPFYTRHDIMNKLRGKRLFTEIEKGFKKHPEDDDMEFGKQFGLSRDFQDKKLKLIFDHLNKAVGVSKKELEKEYK